MSKIKKIIAIVGIIAIIMTLSICLVACGGNDCEYGVLVTRGEQMDVTEYQGDKVDLEIHPFCIGYYIQVAKCNKDGELILDDDGNIQYGYFRTADQKLYISYYLGEVIDLTDPRWSEANKWEQ